MRIPIAWLKELIDTGLPVEETAHRLTMAGLEIEGIETTGDDHVLEVNVTPNRPDCLSILGVARELSAITGKPFKLPPHSVRETGPSDFNIEILEPALCRRYAGRVVRGVKTGPSPSWMRDRLEKCGIRPINNIVDITNYVLLEFGHPLHAFDLKTLKGATIRVGVAGPGASITTLDGSVRELPDDALLIMDAERPVAVAGVMGGAETEISQSTTDIFLESAYFKPESVRRTSKLLGLSTEASYRFERGTDVLMLEHAMDRASGLMAELCGGEVRAKVDAWPTPYSPRTVRASYHRINLVLGMEVPKAQTLEILKRLGLSPRDEGLEVSIEPPPYRGDITMEADVIEEVARLLGFEAIPTLAPRASIEAQNPNPELARLRTAKDTLATLGFYEAVNYSFMDSRDLDALGLSHSDTRRKAVGVLNPLRSEDALMRTTLLPALMRNLAFNLSQGTREVRLFESSRVFINEGSALPREPRMLAAVLMNDDAPALFREGAEPFHLLKGALESLLERLRARDVSFARSKETFLHPGKAAEVVVEGKRVGYIGVILPDAQARFEIKSRRDAVAFELDLDMLFSAAPVERAYKPLPRFPAVQRDVAIVLDAAIEAAGLLKAIREHPSPLIEDASVFDEYKGKNIPSGKKSLGLNIRYRSPERTLTDQEVDSAHKALVEDLLMKTSGQLRA